MAAHDPVPVEDIECVAMVEILTLKNNNAKISIAAMKLYRPILQLWRTCWLVDLLGSR